jgi:TolB protein
VKFQWPSLFIALLMTSCGSGDLAAGNGCDVPANGAGFLTYVSRRLAADGLAMQYQIFTAKTDGSCEARLDVGPSNDLSPTWHSSSRRLAYSSQRSGVLRLVVHDLASGTEYVVDSGNLQVSNPAISPNGNAVVFEGRGPTGEPDLFLLPVSGGTPAALASNLMTDAGPAWSSDGLTVYYVSNRSGVFDIWRVNSDGTGAVQMTTNSSILGKPTISPDGLNLAYARLGTGASTEVVIRTLSSGDERVVGLPDDVEPAFDSTGSKLAVRTSRFGGNDVVILDAATGALLSRVTHGTFRAGLPAFPR